MRTSLQKEGFKSKIQELPSQVLEISSDVQASDSGWLITFASNCGQPYNWLFWRHICQSWKPLSFVTVAEPRYRCYRCIFSTLMIASLTGRRWWKHVFKFITVLQHLKTWRRIIAKWKNEFVELAMRKRMYHVFLAIGTDIDLTVGNAIIKNTKKTE